MIQAQVTNNRLVSTKAERDSIFPWPKVGDINEAGVKRAHFDGEGHFQALAAARLRRGLPFGMREDRGMWSMDCRRHEQPPECNLREALLQ